MESRNALPLWLSISTMLLAVGCASFNKPEVDPLYGLNDERESDRGMFAKPTEKLLTSAKAAMGLGPDESAAREHYQRAMRIYQSAADAEGDQRKEQFLDASKAFAKSADRWPSSSVEEDALFHQAESLFFAERYPRAEDKFAMLVKKYANTKYIDTLSKRRFQMAKYWLDHYQQDKDLPVTPNLTAKDRPVFDKYGHAIRILEQIRLDDPTGELADDATMLAASASFREGKYYRADEFLTDLRRSFPSSQHQYAAHMLGLRCKVELYQGPSYDAGPLDAAEELIKQMRRQFPTESAKDTELLATAWKDVRMNRAIREMKLAQYRDRRNEVRAARTQYEKIVRDYSDTSLAQNAEERLAQLGGRPDLPPQRLQWLARVFPTTEPEQPLLATRPDSATRR